MTMGKGLGFAVFWHGLYDFLLFLEEPVLSLLAFLAVGILVVGLLEKMQLLVRTTPAG